MKPIIQNKKDLVFYNNNIVSKIKTLAKKTKNKRARVCIHKNLASKTNEMIIALKKGSYIRPHRHPFKVRIISCHRRKNGCICFSRKGKKVKVINMGDYKSKLNFYYRMNKSFFHLPVAVSNWCVYHEVYSGPFKKNQDVKYARWSPVENDNISVNKFLKEIGYIF